MERPPFVYPFISWWTFGLFPLLGYCGHRVAYNLILFIHQVLLFIPPKFFAASASLLMLQAFLIYLPGTSQHNPSLPHPITCHPLNPPPPVQQLLQHPPSHTHALRFPFPTFQLVPPVQSEQDPKPVCLSLLLFCLSPAPKIVLRIKWKDAERTKMNWKHSLYKSRSQKWKLVSYRKE